MKPQIEVSFIVLGLPSTASWDEVRHAYKKRIQACHPDKFVGHSELQSYAAEQTRALIQAYQELKRHFGTNERRAAVEHKARSTARHAGRNQGNVQYAHHSHRRYRRYKRNSPLRHLATVSDVIFSTARFVASPSTICLFLILGMVMGYPSPYRIREKLRTTFMALEQKMQGAAARSSFDGTQYINVQTGQYSQF
jgi:hypothetical protein